MTIKDRIVEFIKDRYYFHVDDLKRYLENKKVQVKDDSLKKALIRLKMDKTIYQAGRGWYSTIENVVRLNTEPIEPIIELIREELPLLDVSCWSTIQRREFFHHLPNRFVTFMYADRDALASLKDLLSEHGFMPYLNPGKKEAEKYIELSEKIVILRPSVSQERPKSSFFTPFERILVDLFMESKALNLLDNREVIRIVSDIATNYRINVGEMLDYADRRGMKESIRKTVPALKSTNAKQEQNLA